MKPQTSPLARDLTLTLGCLALLLAWDSTGWDLAAARFFGNSRGFGLRDTWWASALLHDGGRALAWGLLGLLAVAAWRAPAQGTAGLPGRAERWRWWGVMLVCAVAVPLLKRVSLTSCPWELAEFGGVAHYVSHWRWGFGDGGPGHCFPSGHAVAAFAFFGQYFLWRGHDAGRARWWLAGVLAAGALFGTAQMVRGAHYPSHTLWTAFSCWLICVAAAHFQALRSKAV
jgi:membrane-associated PAP2 superfamily phosphatase